jgi:hypothetical protein
MWTRRQFLSRGGLAFATAGTCLTFAGGGPPDKSDREALPDGSAARGMMTARTDQAIDRGLAYLADPRQHHRDGSFGSNAYAGNVAVTSLSALAFMAAGHQPNRGPYGQLVTDALRFVLKQEDRNKPGYLHNPTATPHGPMYGHGFGTLFLAEVSGMVQDKALREEVNGTLHRAVKLIVNSQNFEGGWRYTPGTNEADISVTICQIMALRAARNAGVDVPKDKVDKCVVYVKKCQDLNQGWFRYMLNGGGMGPQQAFARTAAGVVALYSAGIYDGREVEAGLAFLMKNKPGGRGDLGFRPDIHYFYGHYYAVQAMYTAGNPRWAEWFPLIRDELVANQSADGSWTDPICRHYGTAMACLILQVPNNYLPILQK